MKVRKWISSVDFLAPDVSLNVCGASSIKTLVGSVMSLMCLGVFSWMSYLSIVEYLSTSTPKISQEVTTSEIYPKVDLLKDKHFPILFFYYDDETSLTPAEVQKYLTFQYKKYRYISGAVNGELISEIINMPLVPCADLIAQNKTGTMVVGNSGYLNNLSAEFGMCVDVIESEAYVGGRSSDSIYDVVGLNIYPCTLPSGCADPSEISKIGFTIAFPKPNLNLGNYEGPVEYNTDADNYYYINPLIGQRYENKLMTTNIFDDKGFLSAKSLRSSITHSERIQMNLLYRDGSQTQCLPEELESYDCKGYFFFEIISGGTVVKITRSYKGFIETCGDIGGIKELIYLVFFYLYIFYNQRATKTMLVEQVYNMKKGSSCCKKKKQVKPSAKEESLKIEGLGHAPEHVFEKAFTLIEESLDIITLAKEANSIRFLSSFLMTEYHRVLVPLVSLNNELRRENERIDLNRELAKKGTSPDTIFKALGFAFQNIEKVIDPYTSYLYLQDKANPSNREKPKIHIKPMMKTAVPKRSNKIIDEMEEELNEFCIKSLDKGDFNPFRNAFSKLRQGTHHIGEQKNDRDEKANPISSLFNLDFNNLAPSEGDPFKSQILN